MTAPRAPANRAYIPEPGDTDQDRLEWATNEIARLRAELAALREPAGDALVEVAARRLAAVKMGLVNDPNGEGLPDVLWRQAVPQARAVLDAVLPRVRAEGWRPIETYDPTEHGDRVLIWTAHRALEIGYNDAWDEDQCWRDLEGDELMAPIAWRPLPPPPDAAP